MTAIIEFLLAPAFFNKLMMFLSLCAAIRWAIAGDYNQALYWFFACCITASLTFKIGGAG